VDKGGKRGVREILQNAWNRRRELMEFPKWVTVKRGKLHWTVRKSRLSQEIAGNEVVGKKKFRRREARTGSVEKEGGTRYLSSQKLGGKILKENPCGKRGRRRNSREKGKEGRGLE